MQKLEPDYRDYKLRPFGQDADVSREFYDELIAMTDWDQGADPEDLTRSQDLSRWGWCKVHNGSFQPHGHGDRVRLIRVGICGSCDHALDMWRMRDDPETARINGKHWRVGHVMELEADPNKSLNEIIAEAQKTPGQWGKGMSGAIMAIQFSDGRVVVTDDLWGQGDIPETVAQLLPDNATFLEV